LAKVRIMGAAVGNIIATIIATQMARKRGAPMSIVSMFSMCSTSAMEDCQTRTAHAAAARARSEPRIKARARDSGEET
jgi:hypothetical protein